MWQVVVAIPKIVVSEKRGKQQVSGQISRQTVEKISKIPKKQELTSWSKLRSFA